MIATCKAYIRDGVTNVWDHSDIELMKRITDCIRLNEAYQRQYSKVKQRLLETPSERQFDFRYCTFLHSFLLLTKSSSMFFIV